MIQNSEKSYVRGFGKLPLIAAARFTPANGANPTTVHAAGIETIARAAEGQWDLTLSNDVLDVLASGFPFAQLCVHISFVDDATADMGHLGVVISMNEATGVIRIGHKSGAGAGAWAFDDVQGITGVMVLVYALEA